MGMEEVVKGGWGKGNIFYNRLWINHKMKGEDYERLWDRQEGKCICGKEFAHPRREGTKGVKPNVSKGRLLCSSCRRKG